MHNVDINYEEELSCPHCGNMDTSLVLVLDGVTCSPMRKFLLTGRKREHIWRKGVGNLQEGIQGANSLTFPIGTCSRDNISTKLVMKRLVREIVFDRPSITHKELEFLTADDVNIESGLSAFLVYITEVMEGETATETTVRIKHSCKGASKFLDDLAAGTPVYGGLVKKPADAINMLIKLVYVGVYDASMAVTATLTFPSFHNLMISLKATHIDALPGLRQIILTLIKSLQVIFIYPRNYITIKPYTCYARRHMQTL